MAPLERVLLAFLTTAALLSVTSASHAQLRSSPGAGTAIGGASPSTASGAGATNPSNTSPSSEPAQSFSGTCQLRVALAGSIAGAIASMNEEFVALAAGLAETLELSKYLHGQIATLFEPTRYEGESDEHFAMRVDAFEAEREDLESDYQDQLRLILKLQAELEEITRNQKAALENHSEILAGCSTGSRPMRPTVR